MTDPLAEFNRQDWADVPYVIQLRGGPADGQYFDVRTLPRAWQVPVLAPLSFELARPDLFPAESQALTYWPIGEVTDDGHHIYALR